jgi:precorrin-6B methylase 2
MLIDSLRTIKNAFINDELKNHRVMFGLCKGCYLPLNLHHQFRMVLGLYETEIANIVKSYLHPGDCCYDIGAGYGYYTMAFAKICSPAKIIAIDGDPELVAELKKVVPMNKHFNSEVQIIEGFVGSSFDASKNTTTIDHLVYEEHYPLPQLLKIDIEGGEFEALKGATQVIRHGKPKMVIEVHSEELESQCCDFLESFGYKCTVVGQNLKLKEVRHLEHNGWLCAVASDA